jgi:hypothetical protein
MSQHPWTSDKMTELPKPLPYREKLKLSSLLFVV